MTNDRLANFLLYIERAEKRRHHDLMFNECIETGGHWLRPYGEPVQIHLHGVIGQGDSDEQAIASWIRAARLSRPDLVRATDGRLDDPYNGQVAI